MNNHLLDMLDRILILAPNHRLKEESLAALTGLGADVVAVGLWGELERELCERGASLALLLSPLQGRELAVRISELRLLSPQLQIFLLWWNTTDRWAIESLLCGVNQIYTLPCCVERLRRRVTQVLQQRRGYA